MKVFSLIIFILVNYLNLTLGKLTPDMGASKNTSYIVNVFGSGAAIGECTGFIIDQETVLTAAQCVFGYPNEDIKVCTRLVDYCPQDPYVCTSPSSVYIHNNYFNDLLNGEVSTPLALLKFEPFFFRKYQVAPLNLAEDCQCSTFVNSGAETFDCVPNQGLVKRSVFVDDFTYYGPRYAYPEPQYSLFYAIPYEEPLQCVGLPGSPLIKDGNVIGMKIYCQKNCQQKSYSVYICLVPFEFQFSRFESIFILHDELLLKLAALSLQEKLNLRRFLLNYDESAECPRIYNNTANYYD